MYNNNYVKTPNVKDRRNKANTQGAGDIIQLISQRELSNFWVGGDENSFRCFHFGPKIECIVLKITCNF